MKKPIEGDWVRLPNNKIGVLERHLKSGEALVRIPSLTNWPFPEWDVVNADHLEKERMPKIVKQEPPIEKLGPSPF